ncbi:hypothetical protein [Thalassobium sp. R2A62]|uniref:hypothetical protein n=1 Tax=Thalassobium sp. R2A62 TaxID=633131 RepID=UPI0001B1D511|nr:hypothetical protein [Thalassobium sp. R2A62]EET48540.1 hypothetical protein TR2A62_2325 [Thalassobium sp. R2A62]
MFWWRKRARLLRKAVQETGFLFQNPPHFTGLERARADAAARLAGRPLIQFPPDLSEQAKAAKPSIYGALAPMARCF